MAQQYVSTDGTFIIPGAYPTWKVAKDNSGLATTGVVMLVGEAEEGPDATAETDFTDNYFGPGQFAAVAAKYGSGPIVDAFQALGAPANDTGIAGSVSRIYIAKTNVSEKASGVLTRAGLTDYATIGDKSYGEPGNVKHCQVTSAQAEIPATTGAFGFFPAGLVGTGDAGVLNAFVNGGGPVLALTVTAGMTPTAFVGSIVSGSATGLNGKSGILATGGEDRGVIAVVAGTLAIAATEATNTIVATISTAWAVTPTVGDTLVISATSAVKGVGDANCGVYRVTAATSTTITAVKLFNADGSIPDGAGDVITVIATNILSVTDDLICYSPVTVQNATGTNRGVLTQDLADDSKLITGTATGSSLKLALENGSVWGALAQVGDYLFIPSTAPAAWFGAGSSNGGWYVVTAASSGVAAGASYITATRLSNGDPESFGATAIDAITNLVVYRPVIDGTGKSLEIFDGAGAANIATMFKTVATGAAVSWVSTSATPYVLASAAEYKAKLTSVNSVTNEELTAGGRVCLRVGYYGTTATLTIDGDDLTTTRTGGSGADLSIDLTKYRTLTDLAAYLNAQTGYSCSLETTVVGQMAPSVLDEGTYGICGGLSGSKTGRIKNDGFAFYKKIVEDSVLVQLGTSTTQVQPDSGLPEVQSDFFLAGGTKGATGPTQITNALAKLELVAGNFLVPLFSRDAADDIADALTDASSTYLIDDVIAASRVHILKMSQVKRRKSRQLICGKRTTFLLAKEAANNLATARAALTFQDFKAVSAAGTVVQQQPWMGAVLAAGMQSAAFYKSITKKGINCNGVLQASGDFSPEDQDQLEDALLNGLLVARRRTTGGYDWVSDQTTYGQDANFVFNSIQAVYAADIVAATTGERMERAFVGESLADVSSAVAVATFQTIMDDLRKLKLIVGDDEAPAGYRNVQIEMSGVAMVVRVEIKLSTAIYFIPITFQIQPYTATAVV